MSLPLAVAASRDAVVVFTDAESIFAMVISPLDRRSRAALKFTRPVSRIRNAER